MSKEWPMGRKDRQCKHRECTKEKQQWLPMDNELLSIKKSTQIKKHPYCEECGAVKSLRIDRAKPLGYYTNVLRDIREYLEKENKRTRGIIAKLTAVQMRLIIKDLVEHPDFEDDFIRNRRAQNGIFLSIVHKHRPDLAPEVVKGFLY